MKYIIGLLAMLLPILSSAQSPSGKALSIGDTVSDMEFNNIINYKTSTAKLSDFKGKIVIIDFWATWCSSCIKGFSKLDSLQKKFGKELQVILVTYPNNINNSESKIIDFLKDWKQKSDDKFILPVSIQQGAVLKEMFPHSLLPHYVWINCSGTVIAITSSNEITEKNIRAVLTKSSVRLPLKIDRF